MAGTQDAIPDPEEAGAAPPSPGGPVSPLVAWGNTLDNADEVWPGATLVEYHVPGTDPRYGGMDWSSLRLVFERSEGRWRLVGIVHDQWTI